ncbi:HD-GYP domain-containing protein [Brevibacillus reuszeri]|uniref:HD-GYP domain-containing protein n=1 Tax=Brevibacillus reuszeri TaxID=54915 RepID=UPI000CCC0B34|nr:HD-GYP domain-containing protein [Brevibacillus reuszeri]
MIKLLATLQRNGFLPTHQTIETIQSFLLAIQARDAYTYRHSLNVGYYSWMIAKHMGLDESHSTAIYIGGLLHDIGKLGIPDSILLKEGVLTADEYSIMKKHPSIGHDIVKEITPFSQIGIHNIVLYHHERVDGKGYPRGFCLEQVPQEALIVAVADSFDAMTTTRTYRPALSHGQAVEQLLMGKGTQYAPHIVDIFLEGVSSYRMKEYIAAT